MPELGTSGSLGACVNKLPASTEPPDSIGARFSRKLAGWPLGFRGCQSL
jgi:hypothetical protein